MGLKVGFVALVVLALSWLIVTRSSRPYSVVAASLTGWTLVVGDPGGPAVVALQPPSELATDLFRQVSQRSGQSLTAPAPGLVPLVLQNEYEDSLQGVLSIEDIMNVARDAGIEDARFEPVCLGQRRESRQGRSGQVFFVVFDAPVFYEFRRRLSPLFPEHAGNGAFDPTGLRPILTIGTTDRDVARWWPLAVEQRSECRASLRIDKPTP